MNTQIIAIANQKGGVGKTTTCANLGIGLAQAGRKVLLIDGDPQGSLTISLGHPQPDKLPFTLSDAMGRILTDQPIHPGEGILHHPEGVDLMPADIQLSGMEVSLVNAMSRETILRQYLDTLKGQYSHKVATQLTGSWQEWAAFLTTASRLYKYPFHEQLMIYAQRPDATACAEYDLWNDKMGRYVRRGSKGIALVDDSGDRPRLRYVFDISDTGTREHSRTPWLWQLEEQHMIPVEAMLERTYGIGGDDFAQQLTDVARKLADEYWAEHQQDFFYIIDGSFLEEYDEFNIGVQFKAAATVSITYALMSRCGLEPERYFDHEDFMAIFDFNTPATIGALGTAVSQINQQVLRQIGVTVRNAEREAMQERSQWDEQHLNLHQERGLSDS